MLVNSKRGSKQRYTEELIRQGQVIDRISIIWSWFDQIFHLSGPIMSWRGSEFRDDKDFDEQLAHYIAADSENT